MHTLEQAVILMIALFAFVSLSTYAVYVKARWGSALERWSEHVYRFAGWAMLGTIFAGAAIVLWILLGF